MYCYIHIQFINIQGATKMLQCNQISHPVLTDFTSDALIWPRLDIMSPNSTERDYYQVHTQLPFKKITTERPTDRPTD